MQKNKIAFWLFLGIVLSAHAKAETNEEILKSVPQFQAAAPPISTVLPSDGAKAPPIGTVNARPAERLIDAPAIGTSAAHSTSAQKKLWAQACKI